MCGMFYLSLYYVFPYTGSLQYYYEYVCVCLVNNTVLNLIPGDHLCHGT
jgi:hypothetical protein